MPVSAWQVIFCAPVSLPPPPSIRKVKVREKSPASIANFRYELENSLILPTVLDIVDVNEATKCLVEHLTFLFDKHFPWRSDRVRSDDKPWVKPSLKLLINKRDDAYAKGRVVKYLRLRDAVIRHSSDLKSNFLLSAVKTARASSMWRAIRGVVSNDVTRQACPDVNRLMQVFSAVFSERSVPLSNSTTLPSKSLTISLSDVTVVMKRLKNCAPGPDGLLSWLFRENCLHLAPYLQHIFNLSVSCGLVPDMFKDSFVTPIPKVRNASCEEYRPIFTINVLSKILEKIVLRKWLVPLVPKIDGNQFAFVPRNGQGTTVALTYVMNRVLSFLDTPGAVRMLMIDYSKAFDTIPHNTILNALSSLDAPRELITWITSFLERRRQKVKANYMISVWYSATSGVPQGGVLSPILFAIAVHNNLHVKSENSALVKYADDFCLLHFLRTKEDDHLQEELDNITAWSAHHGLLINPQKTKLMNFQTSKSLPLPQLTLEKAPIEVVSSAMLLGLTIASDFSWKPHIKLVLQRARKRVFFLNRLKQARAPQSVLWTVYSAMIQSILSYTYPAWCNIGKCDMTLVTNFERRIFKRFNMKCENDFFSFCVSMAKRLADSALESHHPLNGIFDFLPTRFSSRKGRSHRKLLARTNRFKNSFISFA